VFAFLSNDSVTKAWAIITEVILGTGCWILDKEKNWSGIFNIQYQASSIKHQVSSIM